MVFEESWGKVGWFLQFLAIFEKWLSRFWFGWFDWRNGCSLKVM